MVAEKPRRPHSRREALIQAAAAVFFEQGYAATSIDAIIERAGGSKRNIYNEFGSKEGLFAAIVTKNADDVLASLVIKDVAQQDMRETLTRFGLQLMNVYMSTSVIGIYRIAITEANRFPDLVKAFYEEGPSRAAAGLAEALENAKTRSEIRCADCLLAAGHFVGMIRDNLLQVVLGLRPPPSEKEQRKVVDSAVDIFLNGVRGTLR